MLNQTITVSEFEELLCQAANETERVNLFKSFCSQTITYELIDNIIDYVCEFPNRTDLIARYFYNFQKYGTPENWDQNWLTNRDGYLEHKEHD